MMTNVWAIGGAVLYWLALPPWGWWWLGWIALVPWAMLVARPELPGRRPLARIWLIATLFWMATLYFIPLPHWSLWIGWPLLGAYLGLYVVGFVAAGRQLVHPWRFPIGLAIPVAWTGMELLRTHLFGGLGLALLAHTQYQQTAVIQFAEWGGAYLVSFLMASVAALVTVSISSRTARRRIASLASAAAIMAGAFGVGHLRWSACAFDAAGRDRTSPAVEAVIVQGSVDVVFATPDDVKRLTIEHIKHYRDLAIQARRDYPQARLQIWPESTFLAPDLIPDSNEFSLDEERREELAEHRSLFVEFARHVVGAPSEIDEEPAPFWEAIPLITGAGSENPVSRDVYNSVLLINERGDVVQRYLKNHCVPIGEYVPGSQWFPVLDLLHPYGRSLTFGQEPVALVFEGVRLAPSICFESTVPHLIRRHLGQLRSQGQIPDYLLNITNDGWFFGTTCLDLHLACTVFRAVEQRKPTIVSANTGFSAEIDCCGSIVQRGPRRAAALIPVRLYGSQPDIETIYQVVGDLPWVVCAGLAVGALLAFGWAKRRSQVVTRQPAAAPVQSLAGREPGS